MTRGITFVGMDVHKASIHVALLAPGASEPEEWKLDNRATAVGRLAKRLKEGGEVVACYEAGPCGFALMRQLTSLGVPCKVIAPALIPKQAGNKVKTDRRDARKLATLFRAGLLAIADKAQARLYRRHRHLTANGKPTTKANVAVARELSGFIWAALVAQKQRSSAK